MENDKKNNPHAGHRQKLKKRFISEGLENFEDHNILELILFFAIPRRDTNEIAHALMEKFGTFSRVLEADIDDLCSVDGIGENAAHLIKTYPAVGKRYFRDRFRTASKKFPPYREMGQNLVYHFAGLDYEQVYALFYDNSLSYLGDKVIHEGDINSVGFSMRKLCDAAIYYNAAHMVLAHNHPHGVPIASSEDLNTTAKIKSFLLQMNVVLIDHFIIGESRFSSIQKKTYQYLYDYLLEDLAKLPSDSEDFR